LLDKEINKCRAILKKYRYAFFEKGVTKNLSQLTKQAGIHKMHTGPTFIE